MQKNQDEQIEKMKSEISHIINSNMYHLLDEDDSNYLAENLYEQGYRKQIKSEWVMIPVDGVARYRCGNIDCCRVIPFGCSPNELDYCPFCGAKMKGGGQ